jgi:single stranded DNA-binding protein
MINKAILLGRIGTKEHKPTKIGGHVCMLSIATNRKYLDSSGVKKDYTIWHNVNFFNHLAEIANKYAHVGDLVYLEGEIINKKIEENGTSRMIHSITGSTLKVLPNVRKHPSEYEPNGNIAPETNNDTEDLPF